MQNSSAMKITLAVKFLGVGQKCSPFYFIYKKAHLDSTFIFTLLEQVRSTVAQW